MSIVKTVLKKFTVIVHVPDMERPWVAHVRAVNKFSALTEGLEHAHRHTRFAKPGDGSEAMVAFYGHHDPVAWGGSTGSSSIITLGGDR